MKWFKLQIIQKVLSDKCKKLLTENTIANFINSTVYSGKSYIGFPTPIHSGSDFRFVSAAGHCTGVQSLRRGVHLNACTRFNVQRGSLGSKHTPWGLITTTRTSSLHSFQANTDAKRGCAEAYTFHVNNQNKSNYYSYSLSHSSHRTDQSNHRIVPI